MRKQRVKHKGIHFSNYPSAAHLAGSGSTVTVILLLQSAPYLYHIDSHEQNGHQPLKNGPKLLYGIELDNSYPVISYDVEDEDKETLEYKKTTGQIIKIECKDGYSLVQTWRELKMVKSQAKTAVFSLTANRPNTHVSPSRGSRITDAFITELLEEGKDQVKCI